MCIYLLQALKEYYYYSIEKVYTHDVPLATLVSR